MGKVISITAARRRKLSQDLAMKKSIDVKGGIVIDWAASNPAKPGEDRGVIAIIKPVAGAR